MSFAFVFDCAAIAALAMAVCGAVYACGASWALARLMARAPARAAHAPSVTVLKPLHGDEPELYENLASICGQDYGGPVQIILGASDPADPALEVARRLQRAHPDRDITVVADPTKHGTNRKIGNLINMSAQARGEIVVISDSDVRLESDGLSRIVGALEPVGVGLVHCLYRGRPAGGFWSRLAALDVNTRFAPSVVVGELLGFNPCLGPTMALKAAVLAQIGGLPRLADVLADDFELGRAVREAGYKLACPAMTIDHVFSEASAGEMIAHELRWARTIRLVALRGYLGSVVMHFTPLALIGAALAGFAPWSVDLLAALLVLRQAQGLFLTRLMDADRGLLWLLPLRDLIAFWVFLAAIFGDRVTWRGARLRVERNGAIAAT